MSVTLVSSTSVPRQEPLVLDLAAEANHRIANNLSLIAGLVRLQASTIIKQDRALAPNEVAALLEEFGERVETVGRLHRLLADTPDGPIEIADYLQKIATGVVSSLAREGSTALSFNSASQCRVQARQALPIGLIVGELVTNAIKYAHPTGVAGMISISCRSNGAEAVIEIADDGVGLPEGLDPMTSDGLGLRLVRTLAKQLEAKLAFHDSVLGLTVTLHLPATA